MSTPCGPPQPRIPVTMLSGFLGAGKTTLLKYILENSTLKIACIVNDLASVNIDAKLVRNSTARNENGNPSALSDMVELQNGCACKPIGNFYVACKVCITGCSAADDLFPAFAELVMMGDKADRQYDRFILENSGVAEPQNIRDSFNEAICMGHPITTRIQLDGFLTVVDSQTFISDYSSKLPISMRPDLGDGAASFRPVVDLLVEQIECADTIILNKADTLDAKQMENLKPIVSSLNPLAHVVSASFGQVPIELILRPGITSKMNIEAQHRSSVLAAKKDNPAGSSSHNHGHHDHKHHDHTHHDHSHHDHKHRPEDAGKKFGITSFVYFRRRPFHPLRLRQLVLRWLPAANNTALEGEVPATGDNPIKRVLRSKGFAWLANSHLSAFYWSHAGQHFEMREEGDWWVSIHPDTFPPNPHQKKIIYEDFDSEGKFGDRRQEIVFIGSEMNTEEITNQLDAALLTDQELEQYVENWSSYPDPPHPDMLFFQEMATNQPPRQNNNE